MSALLQQGLNRVLSYKWRSVVLLLTVASCRSIGNLIVVARRVIGYGNRVWKWHVTQHDFFSTQQDRGHIIYFFPQGRRT